MNSNRGEKYIFIGGAPRSGTTLIQNMIDSHPDICGLPELLFIPQTIHLRKLIRNWIDDGSIDLVCSHEDLDNNISAFIENFINPLKDKYKCQLISEKSPENVLVFNELIELFPMAKFIHMIRDPRAVISSMLQVRNKANQTGHYSHVDFNGIRLAIEYTQKRLKVGFEATQKAPDRILTVTYEKLVHDPENETRRICHFLNIQWSEQLMYPSRFRHIAEKSVTREINSPYYDKQSYCRDPEVKEIDKWKRILSSAEQIRITDAFKRWECEEDLQKLGYDLSLDHLNNGEKIFGKSKALLRSTLGDIRLFVRRYIRRFI